VRKRSRSAFSARVLHLVVPLLRRGRREGRALAAPAAPCAMNLVVAHTVLTGTAETARPSPRNGFTAYTYSPRGTPLLPPLPRQHRPAGIDARVAAPGPHDFAVRSRLTSSGGPIPFGNRAVAPEPATAIASQTQRIVTIRETPLSGPGTATPLPQIGITGKRNIFDLGLDNRFRQAEVICPRQANGLPRGRSSFNSPAPGAPSQVRRAAASLRSPSTRSAR
jgi:hypothetical protein